MESTICYLQHSCRASLLNDSRGVVHNVGMNDPQPIDPRRRIRELMAIPDRDRTDEEWDELNELEIRTAPGNRESDAKNDRQGGKRQNPGGQQRRPDRAQNVPHGQGGQQNPNNPRGQQGKNHNGPRPQEGRPDQPRPPKRQHRRPKRTQDAPASNTPTNNGGGSEGA